MLKNKENINREKIVDNSTASASYAMLDFESDIEKLWGKYLLINLKISR